MAILCSIVYQITKIGESYPVIKLEKRCNTVHGFKAHEALSNGSFSREILQCCCAETTLEAHAKNLTANDSPNPRLHRAQLPSLVKEERSSIKKFPRCAAY